MSAVGPGLAAGHRGEKSGGGRGALGRAILILVLAPAVPAVFTAWMHPRAPDWAALREGGGVASIPVERARTEFADALWLDARAPETRAAGGVPGALGLTEDDWENGFAALVERWDGSRPIVVYCDGATCRASEAVAARLRRELAFDQVLVLRGGWAAWRAAAAEGVGRP